MYTTEALAWRCD